ncbi:zinc finger protein DHHC domain containing protein, putative [Perkinsus marinus ATCC 50983]|uniref:Palmitoyltransferase n=1 Tax=Perkinsus marinus (strain ATCC 50983 / TXsc) TaxID=423536 RepID=C5LH66_PERM5|nr:zinc finger protein DHHC domain containing protein, putative [Perkinsus marinus ATCC 50983]EER03875.1 zinc finger protein DHHC domain containing protein, putative [Perkinsus marinus ATCC 50983]|eukprot:XP_002772059.1 zinc finger protein DHHC domain containing protein, putative [Perkinsus marinus ATCC 50983]
MASSESPLVSPLQTADATMIAVYKIWPTQRTWFGCGGRCVCGPRPWAPVWTSIPIVLGFGLYVALPAIDIWRRLSPWVTLMTIFLFLMTMGSLLLTAYTDPGILPRRALLDAMEEIGSPEALCNGDLEAEQDRDSGRFRYCGTCQLYRDMTTTSHCRVCDNCVSGFDHHCIFLNNCIGCRNYPFFMVFVASVTILAAMVMTQFIIWANIIDESGSYRMGIKIEMEPGLAILARVLAVLGLICLVTLALFFGFHMCLLLTGKTTKQVLRPNKRFPSRRTPWCESLFTRHAPFFNPRLRVPRSAAIQIV